MGVGWARVEKVTERSQWAAYLEAKGFSVSLSSELLDALGAPENRFWRTETALYMYSFRISGFASAEILRTMAAPTPARFFRCPVHLGLRPDWR